jgi:putative membrane protein
LIALPHPELWASSPTAGDVFNFGIQYAGSLHILFGAATMLLFGLLFVGPRKTLIFFVAATTISLSMELLGTGTGFPFGAYSYTTFLGLKIADRVPYSIPLSWFYMGFTSYLLANVLVEKLALRRKTLWALALGVYFLTVWDLALDPAMASQQLLIRFWVWHDTGPYFGMPIRNLVGWMLTGLIFMSVSRLLWRSNLDVRRVVVWVPFGVYVANTVFAIALSLGVGLWIPPVISVVCGLIPAALVLLLKPASRASLPAGGDSIATRMADLTLRVGGRVISKRNFDFTVEGLENIPRSGPALLVARHYHHLYDGIALEATLRRPPHILVALDWAQTRWQRWVMELVCSLARWPVVLRGERLNQSDGATVSAYAASEARGYLRRAVTDAVGLLRQDKTLVIFPEAYPNIDPHYTPKQDANAFLPFRSGFVRLAELAERDGRTQVALIPTGLMYTQQKCWHVTLRFGPPLYLRDYADHQELARRVEASVRALSNAAPTTAPAIAEEAVQL